MRVALFLSWQRSASARSLRFRAVKAKFRLHSWVTCHATFTVILRDLGQSAGFRVKHAATKGAKKAPCRLLRYLAPTQHMGVRATSFSLSPPSCS